MYPIGKVKAINATTVEVTFKEKVENVSDFTIEGLTVSNAAVKQTDDKVVVLTTAVQEGGKKYTVSHAGKEIGSFEGLSAVIPTKIDITTQSVQGKVGAQATLTADVGVKQAGIPVTFNVKANTIGTLNKDQVFEAVTNADGIATFSYTQYAAGNDQVVAYPTGAPTVRSLGYVFWGVDTILSVKAQDEKGNSVNNGEDKTYKVTYLDPTTGKPVSNKKFNVTFAENVNVNIDKTSKATVNGENPRQLLNSETPKVASVTTDAKGEAVFTVSGSNTAVTPVVFADNGDKDVNESNKYEASKLQASVEKVTFGALQAEYVIDITRDGGEEAAREVANGREYKVVVKTKDGKVAANELVNVAFNENLDRVISTTTKAYFIRTVDGVQIKDTRSDVNAEYITAKTNAKGEATFTIGSDINGDYATPLAWIDINTSDAKEGKFDEGEPFKIAAISYFADSKLTNGAVKSYNDAISTTKEIKDFKGTETATFKFTASNQSGKAFGLPTGYNEIHATFTVFNTGSNDIKVNGETVSPNRSFTTPTIKNAAPQIKVTTADKTASVRVVANGTAQPAVGYDNLRPINLGSHSSEVKFTSTTAIGVLQSGIVDKIDTEDKEIQLVGKDAVSYENAKEFKNLITGKSLTEKEFENFVIANKSAGIELTIKKDADGKFSFEIVSLTSDENAGSVLNAVNSATTAAEVAAALANYAPYKSLTAADKTTAKNAIFTQLETAVYTPAKLAKYFTDTFAPVDITTATYEAPVITAAGVKAKAEVATLLTVTAKKVGLELNGVEVEVVDTKNNQAIEATLTPATGSTPAKLTIEVANASALDSSVVTTLGELKAAIEAKLDVTVELDNSADSADVVVVSEFKDAGDNVLVFADGEAAVAASGAKLELTFTHNVTLGSSVVVDIAGTNVTATTATIKTGTDSNVVVLTLPAGQTITSGTTLTVVSGVTVNGYTITAGDLSVTQP